MFLEHAVYNANCNEVCHVGARFELPPGGGVVPFINIRCAPLMQYATVLDYWTLGHEILFAVSTVLLTANEMLLLFRHRSTLPAEPGGRNFIRAGLCRLFILGAA